MTVNPKTKQLRQQLRAASMERNDVAAFALLVKIVEIEPGDSDILEQKKAVGRRLFDVEVCELEKLIDAGNNDQLIAAMDRLEAYVDYAYAMKSPAYAEAIEIVKVCRQEQTESKVCEMLEELAQLNNLEEKEKKAVQIESLATNSGLTLRVEHKQILNIIHKERQTEIERDNQLEQLKELNSSAYDLEERLKILKQTFNKEAFEEILAIVSRSASAYNELNLLKEEEKAETGRIFESLQRETYAIRKQYVSSMRRRVAVKSILSMVSLAVVGLAVFLFATVKNRVAKVQMHLAQLDFLYIQEELRSPLCKMYSMISSDYASLLKGCNKILKERSELVTKYKNAKAKLLDMKSCLSPQTVGDYVTTLQKLSQIRENHLALYKSELDTGWEILKNELLDRLGDYYNERTEYFMTLNQKESIETIIKKYKEFRNEFKVASKQQIENIQSCFTRTLNEKYKNYTQMDESGLDVVLSELSLARDAGMPIDEDFHGRVRTFRANVGAIRAIRTRVATCRDLDEFVDIIRSNSVAYKSLPKAYPLKLIEDLTKSPKRIKHLAQYKFVHELCPDISKIELAKLPALKEIFCKEKGNVYMGSLSSSMYSTIKELAEVDAETNKVWPDSALMCIYKGNIYIGRRSRIGERIFVKGACGTPFSVDTEAKGKDLDLHVLRELVGINLKDLEDGKILPVKILQSILKLNKRDYPAAVRMYLYTEVVQLLEQYRNQEASGIIFSPSLQKDIRDFKDREINLKKGCWMEGYSVMLEEKCEAFLLSVSTHNYLEEIRNNLERVENADFQYCGYIKDDGTPKIFAAVSDNDLYVYTEDSEEFVSFSKGKHRTPYTPIFRLTTSNDSKR